MKLAQNAFTHALAAGEKQIGLWISLCSNFVAEVTAHAGYDWALVDMEHSPNDYFSVLGQLQAFAASDTTAIVRVEWNDTVAVKRLLDLGAPGVLFPMIQSVEEAKNAVAATRYPPHGVRGVSGATRATKFGRVTDYTARVEDETTVLLQLETRAAVEKAEAADIGKLGRPMDAEVWELIKPAAQKLIAKGVPVGTLVLDPAFATELLNEGFTFVACGTDASLLAKASDQLLATVKGGLA